MKRSRRERVEPIVFDIATRMHMEYGDCLLAGFDRGCGCGLVGVDGTLHEDLARALWFNHRDEILAQWTGPETPYGVRFDGAGR